jgi:hypothetical protein
VNCSFAKSWKAADNRERHDSTAIEARSTPSTRIRPEVGSYIRDNSFTNVVLPAPFSPTTATTAPAGIRTDTSRSTHRDVPGYRNDTPSNETASTSREGAGRSPGRRAGGEAA